MAVLGRVLLGLLAWIVPFEGAVAEPLRVFQDCDVCPEMIELPMGAFVMGAPPDEFRRNLVWRDGAFHRATPEHPHVKTDEGPQHRVTIDIRIAMARNEVTYGEWMACVADGGAMGMCLTTTSGATSTPNTTLQGITRFFMFRLKMRKTTLHG